MQIEQCSLCGEPAAEIVSAYPGYKKPTTFRIVHCGHCDTQYCDPLAVSESVYNHIYENVSKTPGYSRYHYFSLHVKRCDNPLNFLAESEGMYWFIREYLIQHASPETRILEIGCGVGYTVYALKQANYRAQGLDISHSAISNAQANFGGDDKTYICADVKSFARSTTERFDIIYLTEVIEHLPDFLDILKAARQLLSPEGVILITTPNKSYYPPSSIWQTESPPVHLWWFSETSLRIIAKKVGMRARLWDFSPYYSRKRQGNGKRFRAFRQPVFKENGTFSVTPKPQKSVLHYRLQVFLNTLRNRFFGAKLSPGMAPFRSRVLAVVLTND